MPYQYSVHSQGLPSLHQHSYEEQRPCHKNPISLQPAHVAFPQTPWCLILIHDFASQVTKKENPKIHNLFKLRLT